MVKPLPPPGDPERERLSEARRVERAAEKAAGPKPKAKIKYAQGADMPVGEGLLRPGNRVPWGESDDNPMSPNFIPLTERAGNAIARFWAVHERREKSDANAHGVYDE